MDKREIRIGNVVGATLAGEIHGNLSPYVIGGGRDIDNAEWFFPLPLTEEWLVRFGFVSGVEWKTLYMKGGVGVWWYPERNSVMLHGYKFKTINYYYVHQLQNLYFALTGEELVLASAEGGGEK